MGLLGGLKLRQLGSPILKFIEQHGVSPGAGDGTHLRYNPWRPTVTPTPGDESSGRNLEGQRLGPYQLGARIGAGGMGEVYKAIDTRLDRTVAVKVLTSQIAEDPRSRERFDREARAVGALNHPHICTLYDVGHHQGIDFLVMEYVDGETLADWLRRSRERLPPLREAQRFAIQIASALDRAHRAGITHRDIKPGNIMLTKAGVKLLDFGLAKSGATAGMGALAEMPTQADITAPGMIVGTVQYMAPEQLEGKATDARTDVFAVGVVLYEMVTGRKAFEGSSHATLIAAILAHEPPRLSSVQPRAPAALERIVSTCLAKDPDDRWQTSRDLLRALEWAADAPSEDAAASARPRSRVVAWATLGVAIGALGMWLASSLLPQDTPPPPRVARFAIPLPSDAVISPTQNRQEAISPDGTQIVYAAVRGGQRMLYLRGIDELDARPLEGTAGANGPIFSPDGKSVAFTRAGGILMKLALSGGAPVQITNNESGIQGASWGADDTVAFIDLGLWTVPAVRRHSDRVAKARYRKRRALVPITGISPRRQDRSADGGDGGCHELRRCTDHRGQFGDEGKDEVDRGWFERSLLPVRPPRVRAQRIAARGCVRSRYPACERAAVSGGERRLHEHQQWIRRVRHCRRWHVGICGRCG